MADKQATAYCQVCEQQRLFTKPWGCGGSYGSLSLIANSGMAFRCTTCGCKMGVGKPVAATAGQPQQVEHSPPASPPAVAEGNRERDEKAG